MTKVEEFEVVEQGTGKRFTAKSVRSIRRDRDLSGEDQSERLANFFLVDTGEELLRTGNTFRGRDTDRVFLIVEED